MKQSKSGLPDDLALPLGAASLRLAGLVVAGLVLPVLVLPALSLLRPAVAQKITPLHRRRPVTVAPEFRADPPNAAADAATPIKSRIYRQTASFKQQKAAP